MPEITHPSQFKSFLFERDLMGPQRAQFIIENPNLPECKRVWETHHAAQLHRNALTEESYHQALIAFNRLHPAIVFRGRRLLVA